MKLSEYQIQSQFFEILALNERKYPELRWVFAVPNASGVGGRHGQILGARFKKEGRKSGISDVAFPFYTGEFHGLFIEFKSAIGKLSDEQKEFLKYAETMRFQTAVCRSVDEGLNVLEGYTGWKLIRPKLANEFIR